MFRIWVVRNIKRCVICVAVEAHPIAVCGLVWQLVVRESPSNFSYVIFIQKRTKLYGQDFKILKRNGIRNKVIISELVWIKIWFL